MPDRLSDAWSFCAGTGRFELAPRGDHPWWDDGRLLGRSAPSRTGAVT